MGLARTATLTLVTFLALGLSPALAETVQCADAKGEVAVEYDIERSGGVDAITRVQMQIAGDFGISTDPAHEDYSGEDIAEQAVTGGSLSIFLRVDGGLPALSLKLVEGSEGDHVVRAGVLSVAGGGVWVVTCDPGV